MSGIFNPINYDCRWDLVLMKMNHSVKKSGIDKLLHMVAKFVRIGTASLEGTAIKFLSRWIQFSRQHNVSQ